MADQPLLPTDLLHAFIAVVDCGGVGAASGRVGRGQSAVSLQIRRLESLLGVALFSRQGRALALTPAGETLLPHARRLLDANAQAVAALAPARLRGTVRLGLVQDMAEVLLPAALQRFAAAHPAVALEITVESSTSLREMLERGGLDLCVTAEDAAAGVRRVRPMVWLAAAGMTPAALPSPVPLALLAPPCPFRAAALEALETARHPWRLAVTGPSLAGILAAVRAGLAMTVRTADMAGAGLAVVEEGLPPLPSVAHGLRVALEAGLPARRLAAVLDETLRAGAPTPATPGAPDLHQAPVSPAPGA